MFLNNLYTIEDVSGSEGTAVFEIRLRADHPLYQGHFPGQPVTPGVVLGEVVKELLENRLKERLLMVGMRQCKFLAAHDPSEAPVMKITVKWTDEDGYNVQAGGTSGPETFFKLSASYKAVENSL